MAVLETQELEIRVPPGLDVAYLDAWRRQVLGNSSAWGHHLRCVSANTVGRWPDGARRVRLVFLGVAEERGEGDDGVPLEG